MSLSWPVHISPMERPFWPSFWTLVDGSNELREIPLHYRAVPHRILWTFRKRVTRRFGDGRIFPPMNRSNLKSNIVSFWKGKCRKHYLRISIVNALPVNGRPTVVAVDGRTSFTHDVNGPSTSSSVTNCRFSPIIGCSQEGPNDSSEAGAQLGLEKYRIGLQ